MSIASNNSVIDKAFAAAMVKYETNLRKGYEAILEKGLDYCLAEHTGQAHTFSNHLEMADTYGWVLFHNHTEVSRKVHKNKGSSATKGNIEQILTDMGKSAYESWCGYVCAAMSDERGETKYFLWSAECKMMRMAIANLNRTNVRQFFRRVR